MRSSMSLPFSETIPTNKLASVFGSKVATYKFYWLISIIELLETGTDKIPKKEIFARMISNSWYTVNYFHLSFGKQDLIQQAVEKILETEKLTIDIKRELLFKTLIETENKVTLKLLNHFDSNVPHRFLSPWFPSQKHENDSNYRKRIYAESQKFQGECLYSLNEKFIIINPNWIDYLRLNAKIIKDFCYWNLTLFLQTRNPNVPDIANKLIKPATRNGLTKQRNEYWKIVFNELKSIECIFTKEILTFDENNFQIDHFVPHAFVSHDLIWNLIPIKKSFNSSKSDKLPSMDKYFDKFYQLQKTAFEIVQKAHPKSKYLEEFLVIFPDIGTSNLLDSQKYKETIQPLITIAHNNGFSYLND